jgi:putative ABC transport system permease protein
MAYVTSEWRFDRFHSKSDRIYRAWTQQQGENANPMLFATTCLPLAPALSQKIQGIEATCRVYKTDMLAENRRHLVAERLHMVDTSFFHLFDFRLQQGDAGNAWPVSNSVVISQRAAQKYFSKSSPIGRVMSFQIGDKKQLFTVSGVVENSPPESSIQFDFLIPFSNDHLFFNDRMLASWGNVFVETYVLLEKNSSSTSVDKSIGQLTTKLLGPDFGGGGFRIGLQPLTAIHLDNTIPSGYEPAGNPKYVYIVTTIGILILLVACINFVILSLGYCRSRTPEVGVRKVLGAAKQQLIKQFCTEAFLITLVAGVAGTILAVSLFGSFEKLLGKNMSWPFDTSFTGWLIAATIVVSIIIGLYPAVILSGFNPIDMLRGRWRIDTGNKAIFSRTLITGQFLIAITLVICTVSIGRQLKYMQSKDIGFDKENVVMVLTNQNPAEGTALANRFRQAVSNLSTVKNATAVMYGLEKAPWAEIGFMDEVGALKTFQFNSVDDRFLGAMRLQLVAGTNFLSAHDSAVLVNEAFVREFGLKNVIGAPVPGFPTKKIRGVIKDFNVESLHIAIKPLLLATDFDAIAGIADGMLLHSALQPRVAVRLQRGDVHSQMSQLATIWKTIEPGQSFDYEFLDQAIESKYLEDQRTRLIADIATVLSIIVSCLGLFGLVTLITSNRTKEIAIRKILGARVADVMLLISKEFMLLIVVAGLLSAPLAWWLMNYWLNNFAYQTSLPWWIFFGAILLLLFLALVTICVQTLKVATASPADKIRQA